LLFSLSEVVGCGGGEIPVRERRSGGIVVWEWDVGERIRRRRGFEIVFLLGLAGRSCLVGSGSGPPGPGTGPGLVACSSFDVEDGMATML
jgi:hypothetical protein